LVPIVQKHCANVQRSVAANVLCFQYKTKHLINVCMKNITNRVDEKKKQSSYKRMTTATRLTFLHFLPRCYGWSLPRSVQKCRKQNNKPNLNQNNVWEIRIKFKQAFIMT